MFIFSSSILMSIFKAMNFSMRVPFTVIIRFEDKALFSLFEMDCKFSFSFCLYQVFLIYFYFPCSDILVPFSLCF